ncbi:MAG: serine/threonine protein kinase, partial [Bradymonadaceae bacterium]
MSSTDHVQREVERRLESIREDPEARQRYDRNGDGLVDEEEWELARRQIRAEVQSEFDAEDAGREQTPPSEEEANAAVDGYPAVLEDRFELLEKLGAGSQGRALLARDRNRDEQVVVKHLALGDAPDWKAIELFEREGDVLQNLDHPAIPAYVASFETEFETSPGTQFFLVQEYVEGRALEEQIAEGERWDHAEAIRFLRQMFDILGYLEGLNPPVVHRDIKASNVIRRPDGDYALVDFGAVQAVLPEASGSSTVIGTGGYVPPEQLMGRAEPASDLYAVGATVLHMMSGTHPAELPMDQMRFRTGEIISEPDPFVDFLDRLVDPGARADDER